MSEGKAALLMFKGILAELPVAERAEVEGIREQIKEIVSDGGDAGLLALQWLAIEMAAE